MSTLDPKQKVQLIRKGNEAFNSGDYDLARKCFVSASYQDGLRRLGDYWYREKHKPLYALGFYRQAGDKAMVQELFTRMSMALKHWVSEKPLPKIEMPVVDPNNDPLKQKALEILAQQQG